MPAALSSYLTTAKNHTKWTSSGAEIPKTQLFSPKAQRSKNLKAKRSLSERSKRSPTNLSQIYTSYPPHSRAFLVE